MMKKLLWLLYQPYKFLIFMPLFALSTIVAGVSAVVIATVATPRVASLSGMVWARVNSFLAPMLLTVDGRENIDPKQSYVIVSNHQSHFDIFALYGWLGIDFKWVMKVELRKVPVIGLACEKLGHIYIDRSNTEAAIRTIREAREKVVDGTSIIFFPEGTRSRDGRLIRFKKGAFKMAVDLGIPLLPVTITGTHAILPPKTLNLFPGRARMIIHPPIDVTGLGPGDARMLMETTRTLLDPANYPPASGNRSDS